MQEINLHGKITAGGSLPVIESKNITENGSYTAPSGVDGFNPVVVNVPGPVIESKNITENGNYTAPSGVDGFSPVVVNVPVPTPVIESKNITENGSYTAPSGVDGFSPVVVAVPSSIFLTNNIVSWTEGATSIIYAIDSMASVWNGQANIGAQFYSNANLRGYSKIKVSGTAGTSYYQDHQQNIYKLTLGLSSVKPTNPNQLVTIGTPVLSGPINENFSMELDIPANTDCWLYFTHSAYNVTNLKIEVV